MQFTQEQQNITSFFKANPLTNLLISANAGSGKTTQLVQLSDHCKPNSYFLAFNKTIATTLDEKVLGAVCKTINGFGFGICRNSPTIRSWRVDVRKYDNIIKDVVGLYGHRLDRHQLKELKNQVDSFRQANEANADEVLEEVCNVLKAQTLEERKAAKTMFDDIISRGLTEPKTVDFTDQVWLPVKLDAKFPKIGDLFVDEVQDLTPLQYAFIKKCNAERYIFVGDPKQAIYAFTGADANAFRSCKTQFNCHQLPLTQCFRVPNNTLRYAKLVCPTIHSDFEYPQTDTPAQLKQLTKLYRNNASLIQTYLSLTPSQRENTVVRCTFSPWKYIYTILGLPKDKLVEPEQVALTPDFWTNFKQSDGLDVLKTLLWQFTHDKAVAEHTWIAYAVWIGSYFNDLRTKEFDNNSAEMQLTLSTIHQAKGLEWENVWFSAELPSEAAPTEDNQEDNLFLIGVTRHQKNLFFEPIETD